jgi:hypothetical protein
LGLSAMVVGKLLVRAIKPGTGRVSILLVGRLILRRFSFARTPRRTRHKLATATQRIMVIFFMVTKIDETQAAPTGFGQR